MTLEELEVFHEKDGSFSVQDSSGFILGVFKEYYDALEWRVFYVNSVNQLTDTMIVVGA